MILILAFMGGLYALGIYTYRHYFGNTASNSLSHTRSSPSREDDVYYENCSEARADGAESIREGEPGYREELDRDGDGVACEPWHGR